MLDCDASQDGGHGEEAYLAVLVFFIVKLDASADWRNGGGGRGAARLLLFVVW
jgi:hypothetical protein